MTQSDDETTPGGSVVYRYEESHDWKPADGTPHTEEISGHVEQHLGPVAFVLHEIVSADVHIDVLHVPPTPDRPFHHLVTSGMSDKPMHVPDGLEELAFMELMITLPESWKVDQENFRDERWYWPVGLLKFLARLPHTYDTWLGDGHTVPNGDPPDAYAPDTKLNGTVILPPLHVPPDFSPLVTQDGTGIHFMSCVPLYQEEMDLKLSKGMEALIELFDKYGITEVIAPQRRNVARKRFGLF